MPFWARPVGKPRSQVDFFFDTVFGTIGNKTLFTAHPALDGLEALALPPEAAKAAEENCVLDPVESRDP